MTTFQQHRCQHQALQVAEQRCAEAKVRFTPQRKKVFSIIWQSHKALTASEIIAQMENKQPPITYRALQFLQQMGLVHHINSLNAYVGCPHALHSHTGHMLVCTKCHVVQELDPPTTLQTLTVAAKRHGFQPQQTTIETLGLCPQCA